MSATNTAAAADKVPDTHYTVVKTEDITVKPAKNGRGLDVGRRGVANDFFAMTTAPMLVVNQRVTGEGELGRKFTKKDGQEICQEDRVKAKFSLGLAVGDMGDEELRRLCPDLKEQQRACLQKVYDIGRQVLGEIFDLRPAAFQTKIDDAIKDQRTFEADRLAEDPKSRVRNEKDVARLMDEDPQLRARLLARAKANFISKAYMFPNPADYDADGNQRDEVSGNNKRVAVYVKRNCWRRLKQFEKTAKEAMPTMQSSNQLDPKLPHLWPAIVAHMSSHYEWNPFRFFNASTEQEIRRPYKQFPAPAGAAGPLVRLPDPLWSPLPESKQTLVVLRLLFSVYAADKAYGVRCMPCPELYIVRQHNSPRAGIQLGTMYSSFTTGLSPLTPEDLAPEDKAEEEEVAAAGGSSDGNAGSKRGHAVVVPPPTGTGLPIPSFAAADAVDHNEYYDDGTDF